MKTRTNATGRPGKIGPAASRFPYSRPPLRDSTQVMGLSKSKAKPSEGTPQGPVDRGFAADYFGASPVASALNLPQERDSPENRNQTTMQSPPARSKPDISTLQGIGHFYFALTSSGGSHARWLPRPARRFGGLPRHDQRRLGVVDALLLHRRHHRHGPQNAGRGHRAERRLVPVSRCKPHLCLLANRATGRARWRRLCKSIPGSVAAQNPRASRQAHLSHGRR